MRLTSLTLHGFKSFGNRTSIEFAPGVTAVVGPNGSGKSNVIDALKWASGGGRASEFRAGEKTELIFHGAAGKRSLGYAEVELELRGDGKRATIFRSLHRDGTGKLKLNGKNTRFLDIDEELAGSGLGKSGLAIIGQGEVSGVLMADPSKLLQYVAEVAGVARLSGRREQTEDRLATARSHLERLTDLMQELERQLVRLRLEAAGAARHTELNRESLRLRYTLAKLRESGLRSEIGALSEDRNALRMEVESGRRRVDEGRELLAARRSEQAVSERSYREAMAESESRRGDVRVARAQSESTAARLADLGRQAVLVEEELSSLAQLQPPQAPNVDREGPAAAEADAEHAHSVALEGRRSVETELHEARRRLDRLRTDAAAAAQQQAAHESRQQGLQQELSDLDLQSAELSDRAGDGLDLDRRQSQVSELRENLSSLEQELTGIRERLAVVQSEHANAVAEAQARARAADRSRQAFETRRGYAQGPRNALSSGINGVHGSVADLLRVPDQYREAVGAALGRRMEYVVVDRADSGQKVLDFVRRSGGFVTVLPLDLIDVRTPPLSERLANAPGVIGLASDLVETEPRFESVLKQLLGSTLIVRSMPEAVSLARNEKQRPRMVTIDGDIVESYGAMSGGRRQAQAGVLGAAAELEDAEASATEAGEKAAEAERILTEVQAEARALIEAETKARKELEEAQRSLAASREAEAGRRELELELERRRERLQMELDRLEEPLVLVGAETVQAAEQELLECEQRLEAARTVVEERQREVAERRQARLLALERQQAFEAAELQYRRDLERRRTLSERKDALVKELERAERENGCAAEKLAEAQRAVPTDLEEKAKAHQEAVSALSEVEAELAKAAEAQVSRGEALERINLTLARREAAWELASEELRAFPPGIDTLEGSERTLRARLTQVNEELEGLGAVNHRAAQELEQEQERLDALGQESAQALQAIEELATTLEQLDLETTTRLEAGVTTLREGFRRHVLELFGATAEADIEVEREEGRPVGMRIRLQPPGKQTRQLNLLSVGERTMGAMAFLFALMSGSGQQGLPIAILDEVDAPLDEANIRRYCDFLIRLSQRGTQFVLITHQKATFEVAEVMWGVTTEQGVSRVFSIARPDAVAVG